jgi:CRISPR-associated protein Cmr1
LAEKLEIKLKTLTPLWTGGVQAGQMDRIHETGIIGSLRWWYEAIVRGLGGEACDPITHACVYDPEKSNNGLCLACQIFGATGWQRRFRVRLEDCTTPVWEAPPDVLNIRPPGRNRGWFLLPGWIGTVNLSFQGDPETINLLAGLILFLERYGAVGAKPQLGYGVFRLENRSEVMKKAENRQWHVMGNIAPSQILPDLRRFGFFRFRFQPHKQDWWTQIAGLERLLDKGNTARILQQIVEQDMVPVAPAFKNVWRFGYWQGPLGVEQWLFGTSRGKDKRVQSKVAVSWAYRDGNEWEIHGWGWLPEKDDRHRDIPQRFLQNVWDALSDETIWQGTLGDQTGTLSLLPNIAAFKAWTPAQIKGLLEVE